MTAHRPSTPLRAGFQRWVRDQVEIESPGDDTRFSALCCYAVPGALGDLSFRLPSDESLGYLISARERDLGVARSEIDVGTKVESGTYLMNHFVSGRGFQPCRNPVNLNSGFSP